MPRGELDQDRDRRLVVGAEDRVAAAAVDALVEHDLDRPGRAGRCRGGRRTSPSPRPAPGTRAIRLPAPARAGPAASSSATSTPSSRSSASDRVGDRALRAGRARDLAEADEALPETAVLAHDTDASAASAASRPMKLCTTSIRRRGLRRSTRPARRARSHSPVRGRGPCRGRARAGHPRTGSRRSPAPSPRTAGRSPPSTSAPAPRRGSCRRSGASGPRTRGRSSPGRVGDHPRSSAARHRGSTSGRRPFAATGYGSRAARPTRRAPPRRRRRGPRSPPRAAR